MAEQKPPTNAEELLHRYAAGERRFERASLTRADLRGADLEGVNLRGANLRGANLRGAHLPSADLTDADLTGANLTGADLPSANLTGAYLPSANLTGVNLTGALLTGADLGSALLRGAALTRTALTHADLGGADLTHADLTGADLFGVNLFGVNLFGANLFGANLTDASIGETVLSGLNLSPLCEARLTLRHHAPSPVDHSAILRSIHAPGLKEFLAHTGMPEVFVEYMVDSALSLRSTVFKMLQSTFISYGSPDEAFARKLYEALHRNGVTTFFFPEHAVPGEKLHDVMRKVNDFDRILLVCSKASLKRNGVLNEIEETLARESRKGGVAYLIPIALDNYVFKGWKSPKPGTAQAVRDRVVADFQGADNDPAKFQNALQKLIGALKT